MESTGEAANRAELVPRYPALAHFDDASHEWRRLFAELLGTFFLVLVAAGAVVVDAKSGGAIGRTASVVSPGLMVMAIILFMGAVSGAHLNPAVTLGFSLRAATSRGGACLATSLHQLAGATAACLFLLGGARQAREHGCDRARA